MRVAVASLLALSFHARAGAATITLIPSADASLTQVIPTNNSGASIAWPAGTTQNYTMSRALLKFDLAGSLPANSRILSASLQLEVLRGPRDGFTPSQFALHRMLVPWGEGTSTATAPFFGVGGPPSTNGACWTHRFYGTTNTWTEPGGALGVDFDAAPSGEEFIYGTLDSPYFFGPEDQMTADCQFWLDHPVQNHGWCLRTEEEASNFTARLFGSREHPSAPPLLVVRYLVSPAITVTRTNQTVRLSFVALPEHSYFIEDSSSLGAPGDWNTLTNLPPVAEPTPVEFTQIVGASPRFFRVRTE